MGNVTEIYNFSAGPAVMPKSVVKKIQAELPSYKGSGMSIMEISHRSSLYVDMQNEAESDLRQLMNVPDDYDVLFLQGAGRFSLTRFPESGTKGKDRCRCRFRTLGSPCQAGSGFAAGNLDIRGSIRRG